MIDYKNFKSMVVDTMKVLYVRMSSKRVNGCQGMVF